MLDIQNQVLKAEARIRNYIKQTPLDYSLALSRQTQSNVFLKCENLQYTGSFKIRGALNKLLSLSPVQRKKGIVTASSGNHGAAVAFGLNQLNIKGVIFVPENAASAKINNIRNYTHDLEFYGKDCMQTELHALSYAKKNDMIYISPYNDIHVISGQGTLGLELINQLCALDVIFAPIGGGGLISGIAGYIKHLKPKIKIIGCLPENSPVMAASVKAGKIIEMDTLPTLSDASAGGIEPYAITLDLCRQYVDDYVLVSEDEIKNAMLKIIQTERLLIEGVAGVTVSAFLKTSEKFQGKNVALVLSGGNISLTTLKSILCNESTY